MDKSREKHIKLIENSGGIIEESLFVVQPGLMLTKRSNITKEARVLFDIMNIDTDTNNATQHAEFNSRITYLSFKNEKNNSTQYNEDMINKYGHLSVYNDEYITILVAGCSVETELEFIAHNEATVARLTSSKTAAQNDPLYRVIGETIDIQKEMILESRQLKEKYKKRLGKKDTEIYNMNTFGTKAVSFTITMSLKDWHKTLIGRLSKKGVETEVVELMERIAIKLNGEYPMVIKEVSEYYKMGNKTKYIIS